MKTDQNGAFTLKTAPKDRDFELCVMSPDKSLGRVQKFTAGTATATIQLQPTVTCEGIVTTPAGLPADGLQLCMDVKLNGEPNLPLRQQPLTDARGHFKAEHLVAGSSYGIFWSSNNQTNRDYDYGNVEVDLSQLKAGAPIRFQARKYVNAIIGQVVDPAGKPVADATISTEQGSDLVPQERRSGPGQTVTADEDGHFTMSRLADGELTLTVTAPGLKPTKFKTTTDNVDCKITMCSLAKPTLYRATVKDAQGQPVAGALVTLFTWQHAGAKKDMSQLTRKTSASGVVTFDTPTTAPAARPASLRQCFMLCDVPGYDLAVSASAQAGEDLDAQFTLAKSEKHWKGKVVDDKGQPVAGARIVVTAIGTQADQFVSLPFWDEDDIAGVRLTSAADGTFELNRIPYTRIIIAITSPGLRPNSGALDPQIEARAHVGTYTFTMKQRVSVAGKVIIKNTRQVPVMPPAPQLTALRIQRSDGVPVGGTRINPDGTFTCDTLEPGKYTARFVSIDDALRKYVTRNPPAFEAKAGQTVNLTIELEEGICLKGRITGATLTAADGDISGTVFAARPEDNPEAFVAEGKILQDGSWVMYLPDVGPYTIKYWIPSKNGSMAEKIAQTVAVEAGKVPEDVIIEYKP